MLDTTHDIFLVTFNLEIFFLSNVVNLFSISLQKFCQATKIFNSIASSIRAFNFKYPFYR